ncbi:EamA family transporter [Aquibacillus halophilus]|uniref:EamA family transporter n=1 Tax=Aquibacillus halophilus TaxID=930132 RepID=A0A6A8D9V9_9BACI|nr:DMT family transporter [Aquibacillus halophilus]MRH42543.1 EamA family transporter [Aquibacillus halophilus]
MNNFIAYLLIVLGASFWGLTGLFVKYLYTFGFSPMEVVTVRLTVSSVILFVVLYLFAPSYLRINFKHLPYFFGLGVVSIAFFNWAYFEVIERASLSIAVIMVYTSPVFAALIARFLFKEMLTPQKIIAVLLTIIGCGFVVGLLPNGVTSVSIMTILLGVLSGLFCSLYSIIGKHVSHIYHPITITVYSMICGSIFMVPASKIWMQTDLFLNWEVWGYILGISTVSTIFAYILYTLGLTYVESSKASILATVELLVSVMLGILLFNDLINGWQWVGIILVLTALVLAVLSTGKRKLVVEK